MVKVFECDNKFKQINYGLLLPMSTKDIRFIV